MKMAATVLAGSRWPDGTEATKGNVIIWSGEDDPADTLVPRLEASGADLNRNFFAPIVRFQAALHETPERIALREIGETFVLP